MVNSRVSSHRKQHLCPSIAGKRSKLGAIFWPANKDYSFASSSRVSFLNGEEGGEEEKKNLRKIKEREGQQQQQKRHPPLSQDSVLTGAITHSGE